MNVLFICNQNQNRSTTAAKIFNDKFKTKSAGLYCERPVTEKQIEWADMLIVMEESQRTELASRFPSQYLRKQILSLDIEDIFHYDQPELIHLLQLKMKDLL